MTTTYAPTSVWPGQLWTDDDRDYRVTFHDDHYATLKDVRGADVKLKRIDESGFGPSLDGLRWIHWDDKRFGPAALA